MMELLRGFAAGYTAKVLIGLLVASFALWGISGSILSGSGTVVQVGNTKIDSYDFRFAYENQLLQLSRQLQTRLTREQANAFGLQQNVLAQVVSGAVLDENTRKMGLGLSDKNLAATLARDPAFQDLSGQFSATSYQGYLRQTGLSEDEFLANRRKVAMRNQIQQGTSASFGVPKAFLDAVNVYESEERVFDYATVTADSLSAIPQPNDDQISKHYDDNLNAFRAPEYRSIVILSLESANLARPDDVTEEELRAAYESRKSNLQTSERRRIEQLVLKDQAEADSVVAKLSEGNTFEDVVAELGKKLSDLDLGLLRKDELPDEAVRNAAFGAELNKPTEPIKGLFGPVILRVTEIQGEQTTPYEDVKEDLRNEIAIRKGGELVFELYDAIEDERAAGTSVLETAERLELEARRIEAVDASGLDKEGNPVADLPVQQQLLQQVYQSQPGDDTQAVPIGNDGYVWYDVVDIIPDRQKELDEVRSEVQQAWIDAETNKQVAELAEAIAERVRNNEDFNTVLAEALASDSLGQSVTFTTSEPINRDSRQTELGRAALEAGFSGTQNNVKVAPTADNNHIVLRIAKINAPTSGSIENEAETQINAVAENDILTQVVEDFRSRESVSINAGAIEQAFTAGYGHGGM